MIFFRWIFVRLVAPAYSNLLYAIAYGPFGYFHHISIWIFKKIYRIEWKDSSQFKTLGDFFLRSIPLQISSAPLVSPAESLLLEGPEHLNFSSSVEVKGIRYAWNKFQEFDAEKFRNGAYWNFYLAPSHYHWVHSPANGSRLEAYRHSGKKWPVNRLGRFLAPFLYSENERLTFRFQTEDFGEILLLCIGAMGVSALISEKGAVSYGRWTSLAARVQKSERLLGFRLGSTVLMLVERFPKPTSHAKGTELIHIGEALLPK